MKKTLAFGVSVLVAMVAASVPTFAAEKTRRSEGAVSTAPRTLFLADNVVVTPGGAPSGSAAPVQQNAPAQPAAAPAAPQQAMVEAPRKSVHAEVESNHNYMSTVAVSALMGGLAGALVGGSIYFLGDRNHAQNIGYWAAGGVLVGTGVGIVQLMVQESRVSNATALDKLPSDPAPTFRLALLRTTF